MVVLLRLLTRYAADQYGSSIGNTRIDQPSTGSIMSGQYSSASTTAKWDILRSILLKQDTRMIILRVLWVYTVDNA